LRFLGVDDDFRQEFPIYNSARVTRWPRLTRGLFLAIQSKDRLGIRLNLDLWRRVSERNVVTTPRKSQPSAVTDMLRRHFAGEVAILSRLLGRDLQYWLAPAAHQPDALRRAVSVERQRAAASDAQTPLWLTTDGAAASPEG
jgi:hypothetical protein